MGNCSPQNKIKAAPPMAVKTGAPRIVTSSSVTKAGTTSLAGSIIGWVPMPATSAATSNAATRPVPVSEACQTSRRAISPKPMGNTNSNSQTGRW